MLMAFRQSSLLLPRLSRGLHRCDETHPVCVKCSSSARKCVYAQLGDSNGALDGTHRFAIPGLSPPVTHSSSRSTPAGSSVGNLPPIPGQGPARDIEVNLDHLELLHHFVSKTCRTFVDTEDKIQLYCQTAVSRGFKQPFLMHGLLALSALHLSLLRPERTKFYRTTATALQSKALMSFNKALPQVGELDSPSVLIFSHVTAVHVFCDIFNPVRGHFDVFLDRLVNCFNLLRGLGVVRSMFKDRLSKHDLQAMLVETVEPEPGPRSFDVEFDSLRDLLSVADMSPSSIEVCKASLDSLQEFYRWEGDLERVSASTHRLFAWLVTVPVGYTDLLAERRPEALVLLAWYSVLLFRRRNSWVVGNAGSYLFTCIQRHLGRHWERWLAWPNAVIDAGR